MVAQAEFSAFGRLRQENVKFKPNLSVSHNPRGTEKKRQEERKERRGKGSGGRR